MSNRIYLVLDGVVESPKRVYSLEKLQNFLGAKFICDITISKI